MVAYRLLPRLGTLERVLVAECRRLFWNSKSGDRGGRLGKSRYRWWRLCLGYLLKWVAGGWLALLEWIRVWERWSNILGSILGNSLLENVWRAGSILDGGSSKQCICWGQVLLRLRKSGWDMRLGICDGDVGHKWWILSKRWWAKGWLTKGRFRNILCSKRRWLSKCWCWLLRGRLPKRGGWSRVSYPKGRCCLPRRLGLRKCRLPKCRLPKRRLPKRTLSLRRQSRAECLFVEGGCRWWLAKCALAKCRGWAGCKRRNGAKCSSRLRLLVECRNCLQLLAWGGCLCKDRSWLFWLSKRWRMWSLERTSAEKIQQRTIN